ncbi:MAG: ATP-binding cassette domain-containing protein [Lachnospiraceae bacterium]|nr:ATP-binding cassette domain-containing protein [Lachnospiraceae bacterium]
MSLIEVSHVSKEYDVTTPRPGAKNVLKNIFCPDKKKVRAVTDISFTVEKGELVGFIGENGAGKSSTIKMMSGILFPTSGNITAAGLCPYREREKNAANIGVVFGQRSRLNWHLPIMDSFELYKEIYQIDSRIFRKNVDRFVEMLNMHEFCNIPVRQLSLGQRMKAEVALALLHEPPVLYLDEPTIGLDVMAKQQIREFIKERNRLEGTTVILTSHDTKDLDCVCQRIIVLAKGHIIFDGSIERFKQQYTREGVSDIEDMVRSIYEENIFTDDDDYSKMEQ